MRLPHPLRPLTSRLGALLWAAVGRRRLGRGDLRGALRAFHAALRRRPGCFPVLLGLAQAHAGARELHEARRYLAQAREADPARYDLKAATLLARVGYDLESVCRPSAAVRAEPPLARSVVGARRHVTAAHLPWGDCRDVDEYARFRAMPPITPAEIAGLDLDALLGDLLDG